jgi:bilin biosynthesis protein
MDKRFASMFNLTEEQAITVLDTPQSQISENDSRYIAASHLINYPSEPSIAALMRAVQNTAPELDNRIVRRKSIESLGRLQATQALGVIRDCLADEDCYTVENAVWAIGEIGTTDTQILAEITQLLQKPKQSYRVIIHALTKLDYQPALAESSLTMKMVQLPARRSPPSVGSAKTIVRSKKSWPFCNIPKFSLGGCAFRI